LFDEPVVIQCYTSETVISSQAIALREFLVRMGIETRQGAVGFVIDRDYLEIGFLLNATERDDVWRANIAVARHASSGRCGSH
jgi:hypothetical protein